MPQRPPLTTRMGLPDQLVARLITAVVSGESPPGSRLPPEDVLAGQYDVSRLTLREAVRVLRDKGVLRVEQGRGTFVNPPGQWSALDPSLLAVRSALGADPGALAQKLTEARRVVEVGVVELAALRRTDTDLSRLREAVARMRDSDERGDVAQFSAADVAFHDALSQAAANPFLSALFEPIEGLLHEVRRQTSATAALRAVAVQAHERILAAVAAADAAAASAAMSEHLEETHRVVDAVLAGTTQAGPRTPASVDRAQP